MAMVAAVGSQTAAFVPATCIVAEIKVSVLSIGIDFHRVAAQTLAPLRSCIQQYALDNLSRTMASSTGAKEQLAEPEKDAWQKAEQKFTT
jgi:hypothetical protein